MGSRNFGTLLTLGVAIVLIFLCISVPIANSQVAPLDDCGYSGGCRMLMVGDPLTVTIPLVGGRGSGYFGLGPLQVGESPMSSLAIIFSPFQHVRPFSASQPFMSYECRVSYIGSVSSFPMPLGRRRSSPSRVFCHFRLLCQSRSNLQIKSSQKESCWISRRRFSQQILMHKSGLGGWR